MKRCQRQVLTSVLTCALTLVGCLDSSPQGTATPDQSSVEDPTLTVSQTQSPSMTPTALGSTETVQTPTTSPTPASETRTLSPSITEGPSPTPSLGQSPCGGQPKSDAACLLFDGSYLRVDGVVVEAMPSPSHVEIVKFSYMKAWFSGVQSASLLSAQFDDGAGSTKVDDLGDLAPVAKSNTIMSASSSSVSLQPEQGDLPFGVTLDVSNYPNLGMGWSLGETNFATTFSHEIQWFIDCTIFGEESPCVSWPISVSMAYEDRGEALDYKLYVDERIAEQCAVRFYEEGELLAESVTICNNLSFEVTAVRSNQELQISERYPSMEEFDAGESLYLARYTFTGVASYDLELD